MRISRLFFFVVVLSACFSIACAEVPMLFSDITMSLPNAEISTDVSCSDKHVFIHTDWLPAYSESEIQVFIGNEYVSCFRNERNGMYEGTGRMSHTANDVESITYFTNSSDYAAMESLQFSKDGTLNSSEVTDGLRTFQYSNPGDESCQYQYIQEDENDPDLPIPLYRVIYDGSGNVLFYTHKSGTNLEITYAPDGTVDLVEALVRQEGHNYHTRIQWDFDRQRWFDPDNADAVFDLDPYIPEEEHSGEAATPDGTSTDAPETSGSQETEQPNHADQADVPYFVSAPALTIQDLPLSIDPSILHHVPLGNIESLQGNMVLQDLGYEKVTVITDQTISMQREGMHWQCALPEGDYQLILLDRNGVATCYDAKKNFTSMMTEEPSLQLHADGSYLYDGTGRENVMACYGQDGCLTSYSYHNQDASKAVSYNPYGDVLYYSAVSGDGCRYRYLNGGWQKQGTDGIWTECVKPSDVNPSDLPPLLILERRTVPQGTWYPNNTAGVIGVSLRDKYPGLTKKWYHVLPVDLTIQGTQTFKMVASNLFYIGRVYVFVDGDAVTVRCAYSDGLVFPKENLFCWFLSIDEVTHDFLEHPSDSWEYGKPYSIASDLHGAKTALLFVCNRVTYRQPIWNDGTMLVRYWPNIDTVKAHRQKAEQMLDSISNAP